MACSLPCSSVHGILQAKIFEWVSIPAPRGSSQSRDWTHISYASFIGRQVLYHQLHLGSSIRVVSSAYMMLLIFLPAILIPASDSSSPTFCMMYSAQKLNKKGDNIQPWDTPFPIFKQSIVPYLFLTVASWPAYRFLRRQLRWSGILISLRIFHSFFVVYMVKGFSVVSEADVDVFLELLCFL